MISTLNNTAEVSWLCPNCDYLNGQYTTIVSMIDADAVLHITNPPVAVECRSCRWQRIVEWLRGKDDLTSWMPMVTDAIARGAHLEDQ